MGDLIPTEEELNRAESSNGVKFYAFSLQHYLSNLKRLSK